MNIQQAIKIERDEIIKLIKNEPEFPGDIPDDIWQRIQFSSVEEIVRASVRITKRNIIDNIQKRGEIIWHSK